LEQQKQLRWLGNPVDPDQSGTFAPERNLVSAVIKKNGENWPCGSERREDELDV
jgi:hypothetical protein